MKKKFIVFIVTALALALTLGLVGCAPPDDNNSNGIFDDLTSTESVYAFSAASAGMIIDSMNGASVSPSNMAAFLASETLTDETAQQPDEMFSTLDNYMSLVESLLNEGGYSMTESESDREEYTDKITVTYTDINGNKGEYVMYFNKTASVIEQDDDGEQEENYSIEGILVIGENEYAISGTRDIETERDESEAETEFVVTLGENRLMYVEQSIESEGDETEQEYSYIIRENGQVIERSSFSYEQEDDETELKMSAFKDGETTVFHFEKETRNGEEVLILRVGDKQSGQSYIITADEDGQGYTYELIESDDEQ